MLSATEPLPPPPFTVVSPPGEPGPVVVSSPHSGRVYPSSILAILRTGADGLRVFDDGPIDQLAAGAVRAGATLVAARYPRVVIDLNRDPAELDPDLLDGAVLPAGCRVTPRARVGLGLIPSRVGNQPLWRRPLDRAEVEDRMAAVWRPYHAHLDQLLDERRARFGACLLLDCHSMPSLPGNAGERRPVDVALGDRFGRCCAGPVVAEAELRLRAAGLVVARNRPYAGGFITERFGDPAAGRSALQIELRRGLFMNEVSHVPHAGFVVVQRVLADLVAALAPLLRHAGAAERRRFARAS